MDVNTEDDKFSEVALQNEKTDYIVYDQTEFENVIIEQAMEVQEDKKRKMEIHRELKAVADDIRFTKKRLNTIDHKTSSMASKDSASMTPKVRREVVSIKKEQENKLKHLNKAKEKTSEDFISGNANDNKFSLEENMDAERTKFKKLHDSTEEDSDYETQSPCKRKKVVEVIDDGDEKAYLKRIRAYKKAELVKKHQQILEREDGVIEDDHYTEFDGDFKIPNSIWNKLFSYQKTGVRWLCELHQQNCGGIVGDEMGMGKTIQVIGFLIVLRYSKLKTSMDRFRGLGPVILVCPTTVMHQWVKEFHTWWPSFRVAVLHESGSYVGEKKTLIQKINKSNGILITSYNGIVLNKDCLLDDHWHYVILDEGHKIRNPDAQATLVIKQFKTCHRLILSGSPIQNNLQELWSLLDFIVPGKLGTLPVFMQQFGVPIVQGGYANASQIQVQIAYKCATVLNDLIKPYLIRRMKCDVKTSINLPSKSEQVLFCQLSKKQIQLYKEYLNSKELVGILNAKAGVHVLEGIIKLKKICNHPDLFDGGPVSEEDHYGNYKRSAKMMVVESLLHLWHKQGHRVLLFTQSKQMMEILELFVKNKGYTYMKMDGTSSIGSRQPLITKFNSDKSIFVFVLTTRVGGLGVNLIGADRIIIYDPDWNPSIDAQARERAWRIGQDKQVTIYRLLTAGTIEEKIYHRQIFKVFMSNRVLKDPLQQRFFKSKDLLDLFTYQEFGKTGTETSAIFAGTGSEIKMKKNYNQERNADRPKEAERESAVHPEKKVAVSFSAEKIEKMKQLAKKLSTELITNGIIRKSEKEANGKPEGHLKDKGSMELKVSELKIKDHKNKSFEHSHSKKPKKRNAQEVDGEKIDFIVRKDIYKPPQEDDKEKSAKDDDYVLSRLFKSSGVHTVLKHDKIVASAAPGYVIVEGEANRVAQEAIKALKASREMCAKAKQGIPTWTGQNGGRNFVGS